jgi:hypothetical protein
MKHKFIKIGFVYHRTAHKQAVGNGDGSPCVLVGGADFEESGVNEIYVYNIAPQSVDLYSVRNSERLTDASYYSGEEAKQKLLGGYNNSDSDSGKGDGYITYMGKPDYAYDEDYRKEKSIPCGDKYTSFCISIRESMLLDVS